nr:hypothetical protein [Polymorphobacter sp.]
MSNAVLGWAAAKKAGGNGVVLVGTTFGCWAAAAIDISAWPMATVLAGT